MLLLRCRQSLAHAATRRPGSALRTLTAPDRTLLPTRRLYPTLLRAASTTSSSSHQPLEEPEPEPAAPAIGQPGPWGFYHRYPGAAPYLELARVEKPIGSLLLYWPGAWSIALAAEAGALPDPFLLGAFGVGAL